MLASPWIAALFALFVWWFSTGAILWAVMRADRRATPTHGRALLFGVPVLALGIAGFGVSLGDGSVSGVYAAFLSALAIWGWIELSFLTGVVAGPNREICPEGSPEGDRFLRAWGTIAHHEVLLAATLATMAWASIGAVNQFGVLTFAVLFFARVSAKLNLFFGVPKINVEFLPGPLQHLPSHFRRAPMNRGFPLSVTLLTLATACWLERILAAPGPAEAAGFALLAALTALALLEHWLMVLPLPDEKLWRWVIPARDPEQETTAQ